MTKLCDCTHSDQCRFATVRSAGGDAFKKCQTSQAHRAAFYQLDPTARIQRANAPATDEPKSRGLGDVVANGIKRVTGGRVKPCGGCKKRQAKLNQMFPSHKYPELETSPLTKPTRHMIYHLWPVASSDLWKWNLDQLRPHLHLFNGHRFLKVAIDKNTVTAQDVQDYLGAPCELIQIPNNSRRREVAGHIELLEQIPTGPQDILWNGHGKAVRLPWPIGGPDPSRDFVTVLWASVMYETTLALPDLINSQLEQFGCTGSLKKYSAMYTGRGFHKWHYSGTFYWIRMASLARRNWRYIQQRWWGTESYPGFHFRRNEAGCLFGDNVNELYDWGEWNGRLINELEQWRLTHGVPASQC